MGFFRSGQSPSIQPARADGAMQIGWWVFFRVVVGLMMKKMVDQQHNQYDIHEICIYKIYIYTRINYLFTFIWLCINRNMYIHSYVDKYWASWFFMESMFRCCWYWKKKVHRMVVKPQMFGWLVVTVCYRRVPKEIDICVVIFFFTGQFGQVSDMFYILI